MVRHAGRVVRRGRHYDPGARERPHAPAMSETLKQSSGTAGSTGHDRVQANGASGGAAARAGGGASVSPGGPAEPAAQGGDFALALQEFLGTLLERQCKMVGAVAGVIYLAG